MMVTSSTNFRLFALSSCLWLSKTVKDLGAWFEYLADLGFTDCLLADVIGHEREEEIVKALKEAGVGLVADVPSVTGHQNGRYVNAYGFDARKSTLVQNRVWDFLDFASYVLIDEQIARAKQLGARMVIARMSGDQASWPVWWPKAPEHWGTYMCHHPAYVTAYAEWLELHELPVSIPARSVEEDHNGLTFQFCRDTLRSAIARVLTRCKAHGMPAMVIHEFSPYSPVQEMAGGRWDLLATPELEPDWVFIPQVYIPWYSMPHMWNQRAVAAIFGRTRRIKIAPGAQKMPGLLQLKTLQWAVADGHPGAVCDNRALVGADGQIDTTIAAEAKKVIQDAKDRFEGRETEDASERD